MRATWYRLQIEDNGGTVLDIWLKAADHCGGTSCSASSIVNLDDGNYSWRVRGRNPNGTGNWSNSQAFTVDNTKVFQDGFESGDLTAWN